MIDIKILPSRDCLLQHPKICSWHIKYGDILLEKVKSFLSDGLRFIFPKGYLYELCNMTGFSSMAITYHRENVINWRHAMVLCVMRLPIYKMPQLIIYIFICLQLTKHWKRFMVNFVIVCFQLTKHQFMPGITCVILLLICPLIITVGFKYLDLRVKCPLSLYCFAESVLSNDLNSLMIYIELWQIVHPNPVIM